MNVVKPIKLWMQMVNAKTALSDINYLTLSTNAINAKITNIPMHRQISSALQLLISTNIINKNMPWLKKIIS